MKKKNWFKSLKNLVLQQKSSLPCGFVLCNEETCDFRYFYAHKVTHSFVNLCCCILQQTRRIYRTRSISKIYLKLVQKRDRKKLRFKLITNLTIFAALLRKRTDGLSRFSDSQTTSEKSSTKVFYFESTHKQPYNDNLCLLRALAAHFHGTIKIETSISKIFCDSLEKLGINPKQGVSMDNLPIIEDVVGKNLFIYDIDIDTEDSVGEV